MAVFTLLVRLFEAFKASIVFGLHSSFIRENAGNFSNLSKNGPFLFKAITFRGHSRLFVRDPKFMTRQATNMGLTC